jgi:hypothetical protein
MPEVSKSLKRCSSVRDWLLQNKRFLGIMAAVLAVTQPEQFEAGVKILKHVTANRGLLREPAHFVQVLHTWCVPFTGVSVIANRETTYHRDIGGSPYWYDILATMGDYTTTLFRLPSLNAAFSYRPGTVIGIAGKIIPHKVDAVTDGDRVCFAWFMREDVRKYLDIEEGHLSRADSVLSTKPVS